MPLDMSSLWEYLDSHPGTAFSIGTDGRLWWGLVLKEEGQFGTDGRTFKEVVECLINHLYLKEGASDATTQEDATRAMPAQWKACRATRGTSAT
jgi:hypothetical protein